MKIVIAPQSFKGALTGKMAAKAIEQGVWSVYPEATTLLMPIADGGDGTGDPVLWITTTAMLGGSFGIEYLMVAKPLAHGSDDGVLLLFLLLGAGAGWLQTRKA